MTEPRGVAMSDSGHLIVATRSAVYDLDIANNKSSILAGKSITGFKDGTLEEALFDHPDGVACDGHTIYVADCYNHRVRAINLETRSVSTLAVTLAAP